MIRSCYYSLLFVILLSNISNVYAAKIAHIEVSGNERIEQRTIIKNSLLYIGDDISGYRISKSIKSLYDTHFFSNVSIDFDERVGIVKIIVTENPVISEVKLNGIKTTIAKALKEEMKTKDKHVYSKDKIKFDTESIKSFFIKSGSVNTLVVPRVKVIDSNRVEVIFDIVEGNKASVNNVLFVGNKEFSDFYLIRKLGLRGILFWDLFSFNNIYSEDTIEQDKQIISKLYLNAGYADFKFNSVIAEYEKELGTFNLTYFINEGDLYHIGAVKIESDINDLPSSKISPSLLEINNGDKFDQSKIDKSARNISDFLSNSGFANAKVMPVITKKDKVADISYLIHSTPIAYISKIEVSGNDKTHDNVIRREMLINEGDLYRNDLIRISRERLFMLDFFDDVSVEEKYDKEGNIELDIKVKEKTRSDGITFNLGYASIGGFIFGAGISRKNLFGRGYTGSINFTKSIFMSSYGASFTNPRIFDSPFSFSVDVNRTEFGSSSVGLPFNNISNSVGFSIGYSITERIYQYWGLRLQESINNFSLQSKLLSSMNGYVISDVISHTLVFDNRDHPLLPTRGILTKMVNSLSGYTGIGGTRYIQNDFAFAFYTPTINDDFVLLLAGQVGTIQGIGGDPVAWQNRYGVGYNNFRGFYILGVGPGVEYTDGNGVTSYIYAPVKSNNYAVGTVELTFPIPVPKEYNVRASVFCDFGTAFGFDGAHSITYTDSNGNSVSEKAVDDIALRLSVGIGVTWISPFGPLRFDLAYPLMKQPYDQTQIFRIYFSPLPF